MRVPRRPPPPPPALPLEIISLILEDMDDTLWSIKHQRWVDGGKQGEYRRRRTLARCCLVSRTFGAAARTALYREVSLRQFYDTDTDVAVFATMLCDSISLRLGELVRVLSLGTDVSLRWTISTIIYRTPFLTSLDLDLEGNCRDFEDILQAIAISGYRLTRLRLDMPDTTEDFGLSLECLLCSQSTLKILELDFHDSEALVGFDTPPPFQLRELTLHGVHTDNYLPFLTAHSLESLRTLSLDLSYGERPGTFDGVQVLSPYTSLSSLSLIGNISNPYVVPLFASITSLPLLALFLHDLEWCDYQHESPESPSILPHLPPTLESLSIDVDHASTSQIVAWLDSGACPNLSRVTLGETRLKREAFKALQRACKSRALSLSKVVDPEDYRLETLYEKEWPPWEENEWEDDSPLEEESEEESEDEALQRGSLLKFL
ncbi:hypothetical protein RQP46_002838 [Phenoliferia psychrophenolica]